MEYRYKRYKCTKESLRNTINKFGVAIIPNILNNDECNNMISGCWDFFEKITQSWEIPIKRNDEKSWSGFYKLYPSHSMLIQHWRIGHSQVVWDLRQNIKIVEIFAHFWDCNMKNLLVSFDGLSFNIPPEKTKRGWFRGNTWYHTDQSYKRNDFECIQSWITGLDIENQDATLTFYEKSHTFHKEFADTFPDCKTPKDWYKLTPEQEQFYIDKGCKKRFIKCPKGSLVFWDSRTIHCGEEAKKTRKNPKFRCVVYLCYQPREQATEAQLRKKRKAFEEMRSTSHWPCKAILFGKKPRTYGRPLPEITNIEPPTLTELGKKLAGF